MDEKEKNSQLFQELTQDAENIKETSLMEFITDRFKENLDLRRVVRLFIENERANIKKHIRLLKKTNSVYEELNRDIASAKTDKEIRKIVGEDSELVQWWDEYNAKNSARENDNENILANSEESP